MEQVVVAMLRTSLMESVLVSEDPSLSSDLLASQRTLASPHMIVMYITSQRDLLQHRDESHVS